MDMIDVASKEEKELQREFYFLTRAYVHNKVRYVAIDGGSCSNFASTVLVQESGLPTQKHPKPYNAVTCLRLGYTRVEEQVLVPISMGCYSDVVLCDVTPMNYCHLLLGMPWQYDRRTTHDGYNNTYSFRFDDKVVTLYPYYRAQIRMEKARIARLDKAEKARIARLDKAETSTQQGTTSPKEASPKETTKAAQCAEPSLRPQRLRSKPIRFRDYVSK